MRIALFAIATLLAFHGSAAAQWREIRTENFVIRGDAGVITMRELATELEQFRAFLSLFTAGQLAEAEARPVPVYVMRTGSSFRRIFDNRNAGGVYTSRIDSPIFIVNAARGDSVGAVSGDGRTSGDQAKEFIKHEFVHYFTRRDGIAYEPRWYSEGVADYYATFEYKNGKASVGRLNSMRGFTLYDDMVPWINVFDSHQRWVTKREKPGAEEIAQLYAQSWLAVHYFFADRERLAELRRYLRRYPFGAAAFEPVFGVSKEEMGQRVLAYFRSNKFSYSQYELPQIGEEPAMEMKKMARWERDFALAFAIRFFADTDDERDEVRALLRDVLSANPSFAMAHVESAWLEIDAKNLDAARAHLQQAVQLAPDMASVYLLRGLIEDGVDARKMFDEARRRDPSSARAHFEFARTFLGGGATEESLDAAITAMSLSAASASPPLLVGELALDLGYVEDARSVLEPISNWAVNDDHRKAAQALLARPRD